MSLKRLTGLAVTLILSVSMAGCGSTSTSSETAGGTSSSPAAAEANFPITIKHALGETTIESKPARVATIAWSNHEVPLALGVVPVGMSKATWGDDDGDGVLPWVEQKLTDLGAETPVLFDETSGIDFEAVANTEPDIILAAYSGITKEDYATLSEIAPTVAYPNIPWGTSMEEMIELNATAIGLEAEGKQLVTDLDEQVKTTAAKYPSLKGKTALFTYLDPKDLSKVSFYTTKDPRAGFLEEIGLTTPAVVAETSAKSSAFNESLSAEQSDEFNDTNLIITYGPVDGSIEKTVQGNPLWSKIPAVSNGAVAVLENNTPLAASANPSPLSIGWGLDEYLAVLDAAAQKST